MIDDSHMHLIVAEFSLANQLSKTSLGRLDHLFEESTHHRARISIALQCVRCTSLLQRMVWISLAAALNVFATSGRGSPLLVENCIRQIQTLLLPGSQQMTHQRQRDSGLYHPSFLHSYCPSHPNVPWEGRKEGRKEGMEPCTMLLTETRLKCWGSYTPGLNLAWETWIMHKSCLFRVANILPIFHVSIKY